MKEKELTFSSDAGHHSLSDVQRLYRRQHEDQIELTCPACRGEGQLDVVYNRPSRSDPFEQDCALVVCEPCDGDGWIDLAVTDLDSDVPDLLQHLIAYQKTQTEEEK